MPPLKLIVADGDPQACRHLASLLSYYPNLQLHNSSHDFKQLQENWLQHQPDLVFLDMNLPGLNDSHPLLSGKTQYQSPLLIALSQQEQDAYHAVDSYAFTFLLKPVNRLHLARTLMNAHSLLRQQPEVS